MAEQNRAHAFYVRHEMVIITFVAAVVYVVVAIRVHAVLNWIIGPLWPVACVWLVPLAVRRILRWDDPLPHEQVRS